MMERNGLVGEERVGLFVAVALHVLLLIVLLLQPSKRDDVQPIERMTVNLTDEVGLTSTAPDPVSESAASIAPVLSDTPLPPSETVVEPIERPIERPVERPVTRPVERPVERPAPRPVERPAPRQVERPAPRQVERTRTPVPAPSRRAEMPARSAERPAQSAPSRGGGSRIGDNFLAGAGDSTTTSETRTPASQIGASARASLQQAINRQLKPHWSAPSGVDAEQLVSIASWRLNEDGSLNGSPSCRTEPGSITDSNRPQAELHCERAIRAIRQAAPFDLPSQYYEGWKTITAWRFDRRL